MPRRLGGASGRDSRFQSLKLPSVAAVSTVPVLSQCRQSPTWQASPRSPVNRRLLEGPTSRLEAARRVQLSPLAAATSRRRKSFPHPETTISRAENW
jgi:hypothetical protein